MRTIQVKQKILDIFGKPIKNREGKELELGLELVGLLRGIELEGDKENKIFALMVKIANAKDECELEQDDFELLQECATNNTFKHPQTGQEIPIMNRDERGFIKNYLEERMAKEPKKE